MRAAAGSEAVPVDSTSTHSPEKSGSCGICATPLTRTTKTHEASVANMGIPAHPCPWSIRHRHADDGFADEGSGLRRDRLKRCRFNVSTAYAEDDSTSAILVKERDHLGDAVIAREFARS